MTEKSRKKIVIFLSDDEHLRVKEMAELASTTAPNLIRRLLHSQNKRLGDNYDPRLFQDQANAGTPGKLPSWNKLATILKRESSVTEAVRVIAHKFKCSENRVWIRLRKEKTENGHDYKSIVGINQPRDQGDHS